MLLKHYTKLAWRSYKRDASLSVLAVLLLALGVGLCMTSLTVLHVLSRNPIPSKSDRLFYVQLDPRPLGDLIPGEEPERQLSRFDAEALLNDARAFRQAMMTGGSVEIAEGDGDERAAIVNARFTSHEFFSMFDVPIGEGMTWNQEADERASLVAVLSKTMSERLFGNVGAVGRVVRINGYSFRVIGTLGPWGPSPKFYDLTNEYYGAEDLVFIPFQTAAALDLKMTGNRSCWGVGPEGTGTAGARWSVTAPCSWIQYWVELSAPEEAGAFSQYLVTYSEAQRAKSRFERPPNVRVRNVEQWLADSRVIPPEVRLHSLLGLAFLIVCILNTTGLMLAKFARRNSEIGLRRSLGATQTDICVQFLIEATITGVIGALLGVGLTWLGLWIVRQQPTVYAELAHLNGQMLMALLGVAIVSSLLAALLPVIRALQVPPANYLRSQ